MSAATPLDRAVRAMEAAPGDALARTRFWEVFAGAELFLLLARDAGDGRAEPRLFPLEAGPAALAFDRELRLAEFGAGPHYAALPGRALAAMLAGEGVALGLNLGSPDGTLLPPGALGWLGEALAGRAEARAVAAPREVRPPRALPEGLLERLDARLAGLAGLARAAFLAEAAWPEGARPLLVLLDAAPGAEPALAAALRETALLADCDLEIGFARDGDPLAARLARVALRFDLPGPPRAPAPGTDPARPPRLR